MEHTLLLHSTSLPTGAAKSLATQSDHRYPNCHPYLYTLPVGDHRQSLKSPRTAKPPLLFNAFQETKVDTVLGLFFVPVCGVR